MSCSSPQNSSVRNFNNCQLQAFNWSFNFNFIKLNQSVYLINLLNIPSGIVELAVNLVTEQKSFMDTHRAQRPLNLLLQHRHTLKIFLVTRKGCWKWNYSQGTASISDTDESHLEAFMPEGKKPKNPTEIVSLTKRVLISQYSSPSWQNIFLPNLISQLHVS